MLFPDHIATVNNSDFLYFNLNSITLIDKLYLVNGLLDFLTVFQLSSAFT